jgi:hypothetical protein
MRRLLRLRGAVRRRCRHRPPNLVYCMLDGVGAARHSYLGADAPDSRPRSRGCYPYGEAPGHLGYVLTAESACPSNARMLVGAST